MVDKSTPINTLKKGPQQQPQPQQPLPQQLPPQQLPMQQHQPNPLQAMQNPPPMPQNTSENDAVAIPLLQQQQRMMQGMPGNVPGGVNVLPNVNGNGQGQSKALGVGGKVKEFFTNENSICNFKSALLVFALVLIFTSNIFFSTIGTKIPGAVSDGKTTLLGTFVAALLIAVVYLIIRMAVRF